MSWMLVTIVGLTQAASSPGFDVAAAMRHLGFERGGLREAQQGEIVAASPERDGDNELATAVVVLVRAPLDDVLAVIREDGLLDADDAVLWHEVLDREAADEVFERVGFTRDEVDEVLELIAVTAGEQFNLSGDEILAISEAGRPYRSRGQRKEPAAAGAINEAYRAVLADRFRAYVESGPAGIEPYARADGETSSPQRELPVAEAADAPLLEAGRADASPERRLHLVKRIVDDRPAFVLSDRVVQAADGQFLVIEQQYFVGHSYNSSRWTCVGVAMDGGTLVLTCHRVFTDRVTGLGSRATRRLGQRSLKKEAVTQMETLVREGTKRQEHEGAEGR